MSAQSEINVTLQDPYADQALSDATVFVRDFLRNKYPTLDLQPTRVLYDLLVRPTAEITAYNQTNLDHYRKASSLQEIVANPAAYTEEDVDRILGNYGITRQVGTAAEGNVTIIMESNRITSVAVGVSFTANGLTFNAKETYVATPGPLTASFERLLVQQDNGTWAFTITVVAAAVGTQYMMKGNTPFTWVSPTSGYLSAAAEGDFSGGTNTETNQDLIDRMDSGLAAKAMAGRMNIEALLRYNFPGIKNVSIIGAGDQEMLRDSHNIFAYKTGGKADIYVRSNTQLINKIVTKACVLVDKADKIFQVALTRDDYSGFYTINSVLPESSENYGGTVEILSDIRGINMTDLPYVAPDVTNLIEGAYTRFQTAIVQIRDLLADVTNMNVGDKKNYKFNLGGLPLIDDMQDYCSSRSVRNPEGDYVVRAPIPMLVSVTLQVDHIQGDQDVDIGAVKTSIANAINTTGFAPGRLSSSTIVDAAHNAFQGRTTVHEPIDMFGALRLPSGAVQLFRSGTGIDVPDNILEGVSSRNVAFFTDVSAIVVNVVTVTAKSV